MTDYVLLEVAGIPMEEPAALPNGNIPAPDANAPPPRDAADEYYYGIHKNYYYGGAAAVVACATLPYAAPVALYYAGFTSSGLFLFFDFVSMKTFFLTRNRCGFICCCISSCCWKCSCWELDCCLHIVGNDWSYICCCLCHSWCCNRDCGDSRIERSCSCHTKQRLIFSTCIPLDKFMMLVVCLALITLLDNLDFIVLLSWLIRLLKLDVCLMCGVKKDFTLVQFTHHFPTPFPLRLKSLNCNSVAASILENVLQSYECVQLSSSVQCIAF